MSDLNLKPYDPLYPMRVHPYEELLKDQNASVIDKINSIIVYLNSVGKLTSDVVKNWNTVYNWVMNDGLTTGINNKLEDMLAKGEFDPIFTNILTKIGDITTLTTTDKSNLTNAINELVSKINENTLYKKTFLTKQGLQGDGVFRTIASVFPSVTLSQVQTLNSSATLNNSADWYVLQNLVNTSLDETEIIVDGSFVIDLPVKIARNNITISGKTRNSNTKFNSTQKDYWVIHQIGVNQNIFTIVAGTDTHYITFKDLFMYGSLNSDGSKSKHGIEITTDVIGGQLGHLVIDHCLIHTCGGSGLIKTSGHLIYVTIKDSDIGYCYDNGISFIHTDGSQCNAIQIDNTYTVANGYIYNGTSFVSPSSALTDRGFGLDISGTAISVKDGDSTANNGAGTRINTGYVYGLVIKGRYAESNKLADIYVTAGVKTSVDIKGNYNSSTTATYGQVYYEGTGISVPEIFETELPIAKVTYNSNTSVTVSAIDIPTNTFTSNAHGLVNGDTVYPITNFDAGSVYPVNVYPGGIGNRSWPGYYVVNATANTFQLSVSSGGTPIALSTNVNMDVTKWHFETPYASPVTISGLPSIKKCKMIIRGKCLQSDAQCYPENNGQFQTFMTAGTNVYTYAQLSFNGDVWNYAEILLDHTMQPIIHAKGVSVKSSTATANIATNIDQKFFDSNYNHYNTAFTSIILQSWSFANGTIIEVYRQ